MRYYIYNHHDFWQWGIPDNELMESEVVFMWADFPFRNEVKTLQSMGKKVIVYEHGFGSLFDYELDDKDFIADGYLALGDESRDSLVRAGVDPKNVLVTGNPIYDDIKKSKHTGNKALYVALHWFRDVQEYNQIVFNQLREAYPQFDWTVKLTDKTGDISAPKKWFNNVEDNILEDIKEKLPKYDMVFTPFSSTFESFARLMGIPVYVVDEEETYKELGDPVRVPINNTYLKIGEKLLKQKPIDMDRYIKRPSLSLDIILDWTKTL
jgi:hypothetical protein